MTHAATIREDDRALAGIVNVIAVLADNKYYLGRALSEWAVGAPTLENSVGCAAIAQEELGHSRTLYPLLNELPWENGPAPLEQGGERARRYSVRYLDSTPQTWPGMVGGLLLIDAATLTLIESLLETRFENLRRRVARMPGEEHFHMAFAEGRVRELAPNPDGHKGFSRQVQRLLPEMLCWFGPSGEPRVEVLVEEGHLRWNSDRSEDVKRVSEFGPQLMSSQYLCRACGSPVRGHPPTAWRRSLSSRGGVPSSPRMPGSPPRRR